MIKRILVASDNSDLEVLRTVSSQITDFNEAKDIGKDLLDTLAHSDIGVGLAAPQIGINKRVLIINKNEYKNLIMVNPEIMDAMGTSKGQEGCLSVPNSYGKVKRSSYVTVKFHDVEGKEHTLFASGIISTIVQHEIDHLDGKLFTDKSF